MSDINNSKKEFNLTVDSLFKKFYSNPKRLANMLKIVLDMDVSQEEISYDNIEVNNGMDLKTERYDLRVRIISKESYEMELEMQKSKHDGIENRMIVYTAQLLSLTFKEGSEYDIPNVIGLWFVDFNSSKFPQCINVFELYDEKNLNKLSEKYKIIVINLKKKETCDKIHLKEYIDIMENINVSNYIKSKDDLIKEAALEMREFTQEEKDKWEAFKQIDDRIMRNIYIREAKEEGMAEQRHELIKTMSKNGGSIEEISKLTGIPAKVIEELIK